MPALLNDPNYEDLARLYQIFVLLWVRMQRFALSLGTVCREASGLARLRAGVRVRDECLDPRCRSSLADHRAAFLALLLDRGETPL
jgi:hypothetical protein